MAFKTVFVILLLQVGASFTFFLNEPSSTTKNGKPAFCNNLDCPDFIQLKSNSNKYETRKYLKSQWVSTDMHDMDLEQAKHVMFARLFQYISGNNENSQKIPMTTPVLVRLIPGQGPACESNFTMSFFLSNSLTIAPKPNATNVYLQTLPEMTVFVRSFPGYVLSDQDWIKQGTILAEALNGTGYDNTFFYTAGYDSPYKFENRHNEIWFLAQN